MLKYILLSGILLYSKPLVPEPGATLIAYNQQTPITFKQLLNLYIKNNITVVIDGKHLVNCKILHVGDDFVTIRSAQANVLHFPFLSIRNIFGEPSSDLIQLVIR